MRDGLEYGVQEFVDAKPEKVEWLLMENRFRIPPYQRRFVWGEEQLEQFLRDFFEIFHKNFEERGSSAKPHFLGQFVLIENRGDGVKEVVDGQQRLTTLLLFYKALHLILEELKERRAVAEGDFLSFYSELYRLFFPTEDTPRIWTKSGGLAEVLRLGIEEFREQLANGPLTGEKGQYLKMLDYLYRKVKEVIPLSSDGKGLQQLKRCKTAVGKMMVGIKVIVNDPGIAYVIFETLNARGIELEAADLIKNEVFKQAEKEGVFEEVEEVWTQIADQLEGGITQFLLHSHRSRYRYLGETELFSRVQEQVKEWGALPYIDGVKEDFQIYRRLIEWGPEDDYFPREIQERLYELRTYLRINKIYPLLIAGGEVLSPAQFRELVEKSINFAFRGKVVENLRADRLGRLINLWSNHLRRGGDVEEIYQQMRGELSDERFLYFFPRLEWSEKGGFYILKRIEEYLAKGQGIKVRDHSPSQHLEHILPKRPKPEEWPHLFEQGNLKGEVKKYRKRIGNLAILERNINSYIKNRSFQFKNRNPKGLDYHHSSLKLPPQIERFAEKRGDELIWDLPSIERRGEELAKLGLEVWKI